MSSPNTLLFHREAGERPKSANFLKFIEGKQASRYSRRCNVEKDLESRSEPRVPIAEDESSLDPSISELALSKLVKPITHQDRKLFTLSLARLQNTESRQDKTLGSVDRNDKCSTHTTTSRDLPEEDHDRSSRNQPSDSNNRKQSISQRLAKAERYTAFKERHAPKSVKYTTASDQDTKEQGDNPIRKLKPAKTVKISERLKKATEYAEFVNETVATYKAKPETGNRYKKETEAMADCALSSDPKTKYKILLVRRDPSNTSEVELVLSKEGLNTSNIGLILGKEGSRIFNINGEERNEPSDLNTI
jgi:hypothetical protein